MRLPVRVVPLPDESFTSWFVRLAYAHGEKVQSLAYRIFGRAPRVVGLRDIDRVGSEALVSEIAHVARLAVEDVRSTTLDSYRAWLWANAAGRHPHRWIRPVVDAAHSQKVFGQQACLACLKEDRTPYIRRSWRLSFHCLCPRHRCYLVDRCAYCGAPIWLHRGDIGVFTPGERAGMEWCPVCGTDRRMGLPPVVSEDACVHQQRLLDTLERGWTEIGGRIVHSGLFFDGLWMLWSFLDSPKWAKALGLPNGVAHHHRPRYGGIDGLPLMRRLHLLETSCRLLADWPHGLIAEMQRARVSSSALLRFSVSTIREAPFWLWEPIFLCRDRSPYVPSEGEIAETIQWVLKRDGTVRPTEVCRALNLATKSSSRITARCRSWVERQHR